MQIEVFYASLYYFLIYRRKQNFTHPISKIYTTMPYLIGRVGGAGMKSHATKYVTTMKSPDLDMSIKQIIVIILIEFVKFWSRLYNVHTCVCA